MVWDAYLWIRYRTVNRDYWIIQPRTLDPGYYDYDTLLLHSSFEILEKYIEEQIRFPNTEEDPVMWFRTAIESLESEITEAIVKWDKDAEGVIGSLQDQIIFYKEVIALYQWWKLYPSEEQRIENMLNEEPHRSDDWSFKALFDPAYNNDPEMVAYKQKLDRYIQSQEALREEETEMLQRLMKIRRGLWV